MPSLQYTENAEIHPRGFIENVELRHKRHLGARHISSTVLEAPAWVLKLWKCMEYRDEGAFRALNSASNIMT